VTGVLVAIPWRPQPHRVYAHDLVRAHYDQILPEASIIDVDTSHQPFCLAACRNLGVKLGEQADEDVIILGDADTLPEPEPLRAAIAACQQTGLVHLPYTEYRSLGREGTSQHLAGTPLAGCDHTVIPFATSGVYVTTPQAWWASGGQDENFLGWSPEDFAWRIAHRMLLGADPVRHEGRVYALHHHSPAKDGAAYDDAVQRYQRYIEAGDAGDIAAIRALVTPTVHCT
jgi:hypothetical protein